MNDFGGKLRQARERRGVSLRQIAATTKISIGALEALERNDISKLPGGIFSRAFVRSYAVEVGLDPEETVREFLERFHGEPGPRVAATPAPVAEEESSFESRQLIASVMLKLLIISIPLVGVILYFTLRPRPAAPAAQLATPASQEEVVNPAPDVPMPAPEARPATQSATMRLELHPTGPCWVSLMVDGRHVFARIMQPGDREAYDVRESALINVGDAGAFAFSVDGRAGRALGETGQVRVARLTRETLSQYVQ